MPKQHGMISLVRLMAIIFVLIGCLMVFWYTPFYSNLVVRALNAFVPVNVDAVAAKSQQMASLTEYDSLEPGSKVWIARQAYLQVMEQAIQAKNTQDLALIQARYHVLQNNLKEERLESAQDLATEPVKIPMLLPEQSSASEVDAEPVLSLPKIENKQDLALMQKYVDFLKTHQIEPNPNQPLDDQSYQDIAYIHAQNQTGQQDKTTSKPYAIVVLGGGLTVGNNKIDIVVNDYTRLRLEKTVELEKQTNLPIVLSGVEAPYMQAWLKNRGVEAKLLENRSMNTCENTRFSSLLLQKKGGAPTVLLITDRYHMPRTRRLFALNGIETLPVEAPMPTQLTAWQPSQKNYDHSRRANYELLATIRDVLFGSSGCREVP